MTSSPSASSTLSYARPSVEPGQMAQWSLDVLMSGKSLYLQNDDRRCQFRYDQRRGEIAIDSYKEGQYKGTEYEPLAQWSETSERYRLSEAYSNHNLTLKPIDLERVYANLNERILDVLVAGNSVVHAYGTNEVKVSLAHSADGSQHFQVEDQGMDSLDSSILASVEQYPVIDSATSTWAVVSEECGIAKAAYRGKLEVERQDGSRLPFTFNSFDLNQVQSAPSLQSQAEPAQASSGVALSSNSLEVNAPSPVQTPVQTQQGTPTMSTEVAEATVQEQEPKKIDGRTKAGKAAKAAAKAAQEQEAAAPAPEPITAESITTEEISSAIDAVMGIEPEQSQPEAQQPQPEQSQPEQAEPEKPAYDVGMSMFGNGNGANLFAKPEQAAIMQQVADELGVEMKMSNPKPREDGMIGEPKPYISVKNEQVQEAIDKLQAAGLSVNDTRERFQEGRQNYLAEKQAAREQAAETLKVEGAGSLLILAAKNTLQAGRTFVEGDEINLYQTKESVAEQKQIAEDRAAGKDVKDKPVEYGAYDKVTKMQIAKGTVGRDENGQVQVEVKLDKISEANAKRPESKQIKPPTRDQAIESLQNMVETKAQLKASPVRKDKAKSDDGR